MDDKGLNLDTLVKYSFVILDDYQDLEDGTPIFHFNAAIKVSAEGSLSQFLNSMISNSKTKGLSIVDINYEMINNG